jgi:hypothetical protein
VGVFEVVFWEQIVGKPAKKIGLRGLMERVSVQSLRALDGRSAGARAISEWRGELLRDLGGEAGLSSQEKLLVELVVRQKLFIDSIDIFLMQQSSLVNKKKRVLFAVVRERNTLVTTLVSTLDKLGLKKREKPVKSLAEFLEEREEGKHADEHNSDDGEQATVLADVPAARSAEESR